MRDLNKLQYLADIEDSMTMVLGWQKTRDSKELKKLSDNLMRISFYVNSLELERFSYDKIITEFRHDKLRAVERARSADEKIEQLEQQVKQLKAIQGL